MHVPSIFPLSLASKRQDEDKDDSKSISVTVSSMPDEFDNSLDDVTSEFSIDKPIDEVKKDYPEIYISTGNYKPDSDEVMSLHEGERVEIKNINETNKLWLVKKWFNSNSGLVPSKYLQRRQDVEEANEKQILAYAEKLAVPEETAKHKGYPQTAEIVRPLTSEKVRDGDSICLKCSIVANPEPLIVWFKEGVLLEPLQEFEQIFDGSICKLIIKEVYPEDTGFYGVLVKNQYGYDFNTAEVIVVERNASTGIAA